MSTETKLSPGHLSPETFRLPTLGPKLRRLSQRVHSEEGFFVLRGLKPWTYKRLENTIVFTGISSYIANRRGMQCADGPVMSEWSPDSFWINNCNLRITSTHL